MKRILAILAPVFLCCCFLPDVSFAQSQPVPGPTPAVDVDGGASNYFTASTASQQKIVDLTRQAVQSSDTLNWFQKRRILRNLKRPRFVRALEVEIHDEFKWGDELLAGGAPVGEIGDGTLLNIIIEFIENGGLEKILAFIISIIEALG